MCLCLTVWYRYGVSAMTVWSCVLYGSDCGGDDCAVVFCMYCVSLLVLLSIEFALV